MKEKGIKGLVDFVQILKINGFFKLSIPFSDPLHQDLGGSLEEDDQTRWGKPFFQNLE